MSTEMLDQLQENKVRGLEELMDSFQAASSANGGPDQADAVADFLVDEGIGVRQGLLRLWDYHWTMSLAGAIADRKQFGAKLRSLLERGGQILARAAAQARAIADHSGREVARLSQFEEQARAFPHWVDECMARWELVDRARKPLDRDRLARSQAAFQHGECEETGQIMKRLEQGGSLVQE
jgi:hypothetical protein